MIDSRKHFIPTPSYECAKNNGASLDPCQHCDECTVLERVLGEKCQEKDFYDYCNKDTVARYVKGADNEDDNQRNKAKQQRRHL